MEALVDPSRDPCVRFSAYACAGWAARVRAEGRTGDQAWREAEMSATIHAGLRAWLGSAEAGVDADASTLRRFFSVCVADSATTVPGHPALASLEAEIEAVDGVESFLRASGRLAAHGLPGVLAVTLFPVDGSPYEPLVQARGSERSGAGEADPAARERLVSTLRAYGEARVQARAQAVIDLEDRLLALRARAEDDPIVPASSLGARPGSRSLPWDAFVAGWGVPEHAALHVYPAGYVDGLARVLGRARASTLRDYLRWTLVDGLLQSLPARYADDPDWPPPTTCLSVLEELAGLELVRAFGRDALSDPVHARAVQIVEAVREQLEGVIEEADWLDPRVRALLWSRMEAVRFRLGYGEAWPQPLPALGDDHLANVLALRHAAFARRVAPRGPASFDRPWSDDGFLLVHATAWNDRFVPGINLSLGLLLPPVFDPQRPLSLDVAALGSITGHELMHWTDPDDMPGTLANAGLDEALARPLVEGAACLETAYVEAGLPVEPTAPRLEIDETLADLGGIRAAWRVHRSLAARGQAPAGAVLDADQLFFVTAAQFFCDAEEDPATLDTGRRRIDRAMMALPEFAQAFGCESPSAGATAACEHW
ncbi:MAG: hypothetical protein KDK70_21350 [Myxococcales bacterium]|nr:hypothetical protein [Myxococcales bacterium]